MGEFLNFLTDNGILTQLTPLETPQLNGVAERRNRILLDMVRSMFSRSSLTISFWGYTLEIIIYLLNRVPCKSVAKNLYEMWKGVNPVFYHIRIWGCPAHVLKRKMKKLESCT